MDGIPNVEELLVNYREASNLVFHFNDIIGFDDAAISNLVEQYAPRIISTFEASLKTSTYESTVLLCFLKFFEENPSWAVQILIDRCLQLLKERALIPLRVLCELTVTLSDFKLEALDCFNNNISFIYSNLKELDYKAVRDIFKHIIEKRLPHVPNGALLSRQRRSLAILEELLLKIADRNSNHLPSYFVVNELQRITSGSQQLRFHFLQRLTDKFCQIQEDFRPLAQLVSISGRPFLFPLAGHCGLQGFSSPDNLLWRLDSTSYRFILKGHLPYDYMLTAPQIGLISRVLKLPYGKELFINFTRISDRPSRCLPMLGSIIVSLLCDLINEVEETSTDSTAFNIHWTNVLELMVHYCHRQPGIEKPLEQAARLLLNKIPTMSCLKSRHDILWCFMQLLLLSKIQVDDCRVLMDLFVALFPSREDPRDHPKACCCSLLFVIISKKLTSSVAVVAEKFPIVVIERARLINECLSDPSKISSDETMLHQILNSLSPGDSSSTLSKSMEAILAQRVDSTPGSHMLLTRGVQIRSSFRPLSSEFVDSLSSYSKAMVASEIMKNYLCQAMWMSVNTTMQEQKLWPSAACIETYSRFLVLTDSEYGGRILISFFQSAIEEKQHAYAIIHLLCEIFCYRMCRLPLAISQRLQIWNLLSTLISTNTIKNRRLYSMVEQLLIQQMVWLKPLDYIRAAGKTAILLQTRANSSGWPYSVDLVRTFMRSYLMSISWLGPDLEKVADILIPPLTVVQFPAPIIACMPSQIGLSLPQHKVQPLTANDSKRLNQVLNRAREEYEMWRRAITSGGDVSSSLLDFIHSDSQNLFCILWQAFQEFDHFPAGSLKLLDEIEPKRFSSYVGALVDFVIGLVHSGNGIEAKARLMEKLVTILENVLWKHRLFTLDEFLFAALNRPYDEDVNVDLISFLTFFLCKSSELEIQLRSLLSILPCPIDDLSFPFEIWYPKLVEHHTKYEPPLTGEGGLSIPVYYDNLLYRLIPQFDLLIHKIFECPAQLGNYLPEILAKFGPIFRYHPQPATFLLMIVFYYRDSHHRKLHIVLLEFVLDSFPHYPRGWFISEEFRSNVLRSDGVSPSAWAPPYYYYTELLFKFLLALEPKKHSPLQWTVSDCRPLGAVNSSVQAHQSICLELLLSTQQPEVISKSLVDLVFDYSETSCPSEYRFNIHSVINAVALLMSSLPAEYHSSLFEEIRNNFTDSKCSDITFYQYPLECENPNGNRLRLSVALFHAFCHHASPETLVNVPNLFLDMMPTVAREVQLVYLCRLIIPVFQRLSEKQKIIMRLSQSIYEALLCIDQLSEKPLQAEDLFADLLYHLKYMYVGDGIKQETDQIISQFSQSLKEKIRFI